MWGWPFRKLKFHRFPIFQRFERFNRFHRFKIFQRFHRFHRFHKFHIFYIFYRFHRFHRLKKLYRGHKRYIGHRLHRFHRLLRLSRFYRFYRLHSSQIVTCKYYVCSYSFSCSCYYLVSERWRPTCWFPGCSCISSASAGMSNYQTDKMLAFCILRKSSTILN